MNDIYGLPRSSHNCAVTNRHSLCEYIVRNSSERRQAIGVVRIKMLGARPGGFGDGSLSTGLRGAAPGPVGMGTKPPQAEL